MYLGHALGTDKHIGLIGNGKGSARPNVFSIYLSKNTDVCVMFISYSTTSLADRQTYGKLHRAFGERAPLRSEGRWLSTQTETLGLGLGTSSDPRRRSSPLYCATEYHIGGRDNNQ